MPSLNQTNAWSIASLKGATPLASQLSASAPGQSANKTAGSGWDFSFHNLLGIINPLQHLPVVGTLYRAITGDTISAPEKIAGDALYGGVWGAVSGAADVAFEAATGKDFGSTVLAMFTGNSDKPVTAVAANPPAPPAATPPAAPAAMPASADVAALSNALAQKGVGGDIAQRALSAYRRSVMPQGSLLAVAQ
jgi:hypothetical protein